VIRLRIPLSLLLLGVALAGCAVVPGIRMGSSYPETLTPAGESEREFSPAVRTIDADLLLEQRRARDARRMAGFEPAPGGEYAYRVGPGDALNIIVFGRPELSNPMGQTQSIDNQGYRVREDGTLFFPFIGVNHVAGKTVEEIRDHIARSLVRFITDPQVDVRVVAYRSQKAYVTGELREPGILPLTDRPLTVLDAINEAGGFNEQADRRVGILTRAGQERRIDLLELYASGRGNVLLEDGDVLFIPDNATNRVFLMGEVARQSSVELHHGRLTLAEALTAAGGIALGLADTRNIFVMRGREVYDAANNLRGIRPEVFHLDARTGTALLLAEGFQLEPRDIVYVASTGVVRANRVIAQILPSVQTVWQADRIIND
jgi:polysaccharide export outer membrane protein